MSTCFKKVLTGLDLREDAQGSTNQNSHMFVLLSECDRYETLNGTADTYSNPYREVLEVRLAAYRETFAFKALAALIGAKIN